MSAAPFHHNIEENKIKKTVQPPNHSHNRTQRRHFHRNHEEENGGGGHGFDEESRIGQNASATSNHSQKVMSVLKTIQNLPAGSDDEDDLADFQPLPPPSSAGGQRRMERESYANIDDEVEKPQHRPMRKGMHEPTSVSMQNRYSALSSSDYDSSGSNDYMDVHNVANEYKRFIPNYEEMYKRVPGLSAAASAASTMNSRAPHPYYASSSATSGLSGSGDILLDKLNYMIHLLEENQDEKTNNVTEEVILYSFLGIFIIFIADSFVRVGKYTR